MLRGRPGKGATRRLLTLAWSPARCRGVGIPCHFWRGTNGRVLSSLVQEGPGWREVGTACRRVTLEEPSGQFHSFSSCLEEGACAARAEPLGSALAEACCRVAGSQGRSSPRRPSPASKETNECVEWAPRGAGGPRPPGAASPQALLVESPFRRRPPTDAPRITGSSVGQSPEQLCKPTCDVRDFCAGLDRNPTRIQEAPL